VLYLKELGPIKTSRAVI